jgi:hypothetical protein
MNALMNLRVILIRREFLDWLRNCKHLKNDSDLGLVPSCYSEGYKVNVNWLMVTAESCGK